MLGSAVVFLGLSAGGDKQLKLFGFTVVAWWFRSGECDVFSFDGLLKLALCTIKIIIKNKTKTSNYSVCYLQGQVKMASVTGQC